MYQAIINLGSGISLIIILLVVLFLISPSLFSKITKKQTSRKQIAKYGASGLVGALIAPAIFAAPFAPPKAQTTVPTNTTQSAEKTSSQPAKEPTKTTKRTTVTDDIDFTIVEKEDATLAKGKTRVTTKGEKGKVTKEYEITYIDGIEIARTLIKESITRQPVDEIIAKGTYVAPVVETRRAETPAPVPTQSSTGIVKMSRKKICHAPGTTYYNKTTHFTSYSSLDACLAAGGRLPKR